MADLVQFVDSIQDSPTVRLDLSDGVTWSTRYGSEFPPPPMRRSVSSSMLASGDHVQAASFGNRQIILSLVLETADANAAATQLQLLARELDRPSNVLRWQPATATKPVFFRTLRSPLDDVKAEVPGLLELSVEIMAEPFAYGVKETLPPVAVSNDPTTGCYFDANSIIGDVETPLYISFPASSVIAAGRRQTVLAVRRRGVPANMPWLIPAQSMTLAASTTLPGNDAAFSGSGNNYARATSLTAGFVTRMTSAVFPATATVDARGKYRVYVRYRKGNSAAEVRLGIAVSGDGVNWLEYDRDRVVLGAGTAPRWADLGVVQIPLGDDPGVDGMSGIDLASRGIQFAIQIAQTAGTATNLDADCLALMPADDRFCRVLWPGTSGPTSMILDSSRYPRVYGLDAGGATYSTQLRGMDSGTPMVTPGAANRVWMLLDGGSTSTAGDSIASSATVTPYYWPCYVTVRPPTT